MKKGILLSLVAVVLIGLIVFLIWYINEAGKIRSGSKDAFIPYNSALVISVNAEAGLKPEVEEVFATGLKDFASCLLNRVKDTLQGQGYVVEYPYVLALRVEGKSDIACLYVMDNKEVLSRGDVARFLNQTFAAGAEQVRRYDRHKIYALKSGKEEVYFAVCGGIVLVSDSDLYVEDALKQFDLEENGTPSPSHYQDLNKYFSVGAGIHVFLNTGTFTEVLPLYAQVKKIFPHVDVTRFFKWGALDGELGEDGICLNGFMQYGGLKTSYIRTLDQQQAREANIDAIIPARLMSLGMLNLSNPSAYLTALEAYRYDAGRKESVMERKRQYQKMFGKGREEEMKDLLQGEFAVVNLAYNEATQETDGLILISLKSGSLGKTLLEGMLKDYARFDGKTITDYASEYHIDREKSFTYYRFPAEDLSAVYWGYIFEGIPNRYVLVEDNYLIFASSEKAVHTFIRDYIHGNFIRGTEWYKHLKAKLAGKYNMAYFARTDEMLPVYKNMMQKNRQKLAAGFTDKLSVIPAFALQWSNEGDLLYNTLYLSTVPLQEDVCPHVLWQTKLEAGISMKPLPVTNHMTGEKELFVQDDLCNIYLINDAGRILWKLPLGEKINSEVYQVDLFKNGKLQFLFSTPSRMYLIDRNGNAAGRFPVSFREKCEHGISVFDYDHKRDYRIFAPCADRKVYLYGLDGDIIKGWEPKKADKPIVCKVRHFRIGNKDYIVFADRYRLYILDRKGKERVRVATVFDLNEKMDFYLVHQGEQAWLTFAGKEGKVHLVNFEGQTEEFQVKDISGPVRMNVADINNDGAEECVICEGKHLLVTRLDGKMLSRHQLEADDLDYPYIYRFSPADIRIGLRDKKQNQVFLLTPDGNVSKGFPVSANSPFSIVFSGKDGFFLYAGTEDGTLVKYKVQR